MARKKRTLRLGGLVPLPTGAMLLVLFLLPWVQVSCGSRDLGTASGLQLARGRIAVSEEVRQQLGTTESEDDHPEPRPVFWLGAVLPGLVLLLGLLRLRGLLPGRIAGVLLLCAAVAGAGVMLAAGGVDYAEEADRQVGERAEKLPFSLPGLADRDLETRPTSAVWIGLALYGIVGLAGAAEVLLTGRPRRTGRRR